MNTELKIAIIRRFGSQTRAAKPLRIDEPRLSRLVNGHVVPTALERQRFAATLGVDYFAADANPLRDEAARA
jgi:hypothetical protein